MNEASVAKPNVDGRELVTCDEHHTRRMAKFCTPVPVYNADHEIISYVFRCKDDQMCSSALQRAKRQNDLNTSDQQSHAHTSNAKDNEHHLEPVIYSGGSSTLTTKHIQRAKLFTNNSITPDNNSSSDTSKNANTSTYFSVLFTRTTNDDDDDDNKNTVSDVNGNGNVKTKETLVIEDSKNKSTTINKGEIDDDDDTQIMENDSSSEHDSSEYAEKDTEKNCEKKDGQKENNVMQQIISNNALTEKIEVQRVPSPSTATVKGPIRYYDLMQRAMTGNIYNNNMVGANNNNNINNKGSNRYNCKHMCWLCGLAGHEKPECPNMLCRTCHTPRPSRQMHHICALTQPSEFIFTPINLPEEESDGMAAVRCLFCGQFGHFDCHDPLTTTTPEALFSVAAATIGNNNNKDSHSAPTSDNEHIYKTKMDELSCCFCGRRGHTTFTCNEREHVNPDRWIQRMQHAHSNINNNNNNNYNRNSNNYNNNSMWREERIQNASFNSNSSNTFDRRHNNFSNNNSNNNNNNNNRFNRQYVSNSNYDKPETFSGMRSEWQGTEERKRFRSVGVNDRINNRQYNNYNNNNNNNNDEDEREHAQWLRQFRDNTSEPSTSFPTREFSIERSQKRRGSNYNNYHNNNNNNNNNNYNNRNLNQRNNTINNNNNNNNNRFMRQDYSNQTKYNNNNNNNNSRQPLYQNNNNNNAFRNNANNSFRNNNNYQRREGQFQNNAGQHRRRRAKPHEYDSDEDDLYESPELEQ